MTGIFPRKTSRLQGHFASHCLHQQLWHCASNPISIAARDTICCWYFAGAVLVLTIAGCSATGSSQHAGGSAGGGSPSAPSSDIDGAYLPQQDAAINPDNCYSTSPTSDNDSDGYTVAQGDCNDCSKFVNPGAYDYPNNKIDEDCNGIADDEPGGCDNDLALEGLDALDAAKTLGLCRFSDAEAQGKKRTWGVIEAAWVFADGETTSGYVSTGQGCTQVQGQKVGEGAPPNQLSYGLLPMFGVVAPRHGSSMLALSSGVARQGVHGDSPAKAKMCTLSATPEGFPTPSKQACPGVTIDDIGVAKDPIALQLKIRTPTNAKSFAFDFNFFTFEYPSWVCSRYNDYFVALLYSNHPAIPSNHNISLDKNNNHVSVNNGFLEVCKPGKHNNKNFTCPLGTDLLVGTGFENHGATGWLHTSAPIQAGETITLRFAIWDMGDEQLDSTVLIDNITWSVEEGTQDTSRPIK